MAEKNINIAPSEMILNFLKIHYSKPGKIDLHQMTVDLQNQKPIIEKMKKVNNSQINLFLK
jgi:hypothetical protein